MSDVKTEQTGVSPFTEIFREVQGAEKDQAASARRAKAFEQFTTLGIPTPKNEDWKYTNLQTLTKSTFRPVKKDPQSAKVLVAELARYVPALTGTRLVYVNGIFQDSISDLSGLEISPLPAASVDDEATAFVSLNAALSTEGRMIRIPEGKAVPNLIQIIHVVSPDGEGMLLPERICIVAEKRSEARVAEYFIALGAKRYFSSVYTEVICKEESIVEHTKIQCEGEQAFHLANLVVQQEEKSRFTSNVFTFGGGVVRNEIHPVLNGERIESYLNGLTVIRGHQHVDNSTLIDHAKPNCFSRELYKGIYDESARGVFSGTIVVRPDAQKTNAIQSNQSILLSTDASIETRPQLKIWADDVKCTHGATVGQLDEDARFYLRSRGIPEAIAKSMLLHAFAGDIIGHVSVSELREKLEELLLKALREEPAE